MHRVGSAKLRNFKGWPGAGSSRMNNLQIIMLRFSIKKGMSFGGRPSSSALTIISGVALRKYWTYDRVCSLDPTDHPDETIC